MGGVLPPLQERDWNRLVRQLKDGDCIPFIGAGACYGSLPTGGQLARTYADRFDYPFADVDDLARVMQYAAFEVGDAVDLKRQVARELSAYPAPDFGAPASAHGLLARYPLPLYLTTNYDTFMSQALAQRGREPQIDVCPWYRTASEQIVDPRSDAPAVFHLHGSVTDPPSMVLTQDDNLNFLLALAVDKGFDERNLIPRKIQPLLTLRPLLFIGYSLKDWSFQVLWKGLSRLFPREERRRHISVQLVDGLRDNEPPTRGRAVDYLDDHFDQQKISVYWGTTAEFLEEFDDRLGGAHGT